MQYFLIFRRGLQRVPRSFCCQTKTARGRPTKFYLYDKISPSALLLIFRAVRNSLPTANLRNVDPPSSIHTAKYLRPPRPARPQQFAIQQTYEMPASYVFHIQFSRLPRQPTFRALPSLPAPRRYVSPAVFVAKQKLCAGGLQVICRLLLISRAVRNSLPYGKLTKCRPSSIHTIKYSRPPCSNGASPPAQIERLRPPRPAARPLVCPTNRSGCGTLSTLHITILPLAQ